jgi:hypothetical protein
LCNTGESIAALQGEFKGKGGSYAADKTGKKGRLYFLTIRVQPGGEAPAAETETDRANS